jgi:multidrug efflux pump subunit AcrB
VLYLPRGGPLRLAGIADIREAEGPTKIEPIDRDRSIKLTVNLHDEVPMQEAIDSVNAQILR